MAVGKNKLVSNSKKGSKKRHVDPFEKKDWYQVKAPAVFDKRNIAVTPVNRTVGTKTSEDGLKGRVFEIVQDDLQGDDVYYRKFKLITEHVNCRNVLTSFHGMRLTTDRLRSLVRKHYTLIEANVNVKTTDGYVFRIFVIGFPKRADGQLKKNTYAKTSHIKRIRKIMIETVIKEVTSVDMCGFVKKLIVDSISKDIEFACRKMRVVENVYISKVKCVKKPQFDLGRLMEFHRVEEETKSGVSATAEKISKRMGERISKQSREDIGEVIG